MHRKLSILALSLSLSACASHLKVWDAEQKEIAGVPFRAAEVYIVRGAFRKHSEHGDACTPSPFERTAALPTGAQYYANIKPAGLAKSEFGMTFAESGALASITMNTEPAAADTINAATNALSTLLPFVGVTAKPPQPPAISPSDAVTPSALPACDAGPEGVTYTRFQSP